MADMFLQLDGINGESIDFAHPNEIEILQWSWNLKNDATLKMSQQEAASKCDVDKITIEKMYDKSSTALVKYCALGQHIAKGQITSRKNAGDEKVEYLVIKLTDVMVTLVEWKGGGRDGSPETVKLSFSEFKIEYKMQKESGMAGASTDFGYNISKHKPT